MLKKFHLLRQKNNLEEEVFANFGIFAFVSRKFLSMKYPFTINSRKLITVEPPYTPLRRTVSFIPEEFLRKLTATPLQIGHSYLATTL